jgi:hypothetical protein
VDPSSKPTLQKGHHDSYEVKDHCSAADQQKCNTTADQTILPPLVELIPLKLEDTQMLLQKLQTTGNITNPARRHFSKEIVE